MALGTTPRSKAGSAATGPTRKPTKKAAARGSQAPPAKPARTKTAAPTAKAATRTTTKAVTPRVGRKSSSMTPPRVLIDAAASNERISTIARMLLAARGMKQQDLADAMNLDASTITRMFNGQRGWKVTDLELLGAIFGVNPGAFFLDPDSVFRLPQADAG